MQEGADRQAEPGDIAGARRGDDRQSEAEQRRCDNQVPDRACQRDADEFAGRQGEGAQPIFDPQHALREHAVGRHPVDQNDRRFRGLGPRMKQDEFGEGAGHSRAAGSPTLRSDS